jgi:hypothetical protein
MGEATTIGLDLVKHVCQVHGVDAEGARVLRKQLRRAQVLEFFSPTASLSGWPGGMRDRALLGVGVARAWPRGAIDAGAIREGLHQAQQARRRRCGSDLRGGFAADDAVCAGQDGGVAGEPAAPSWPRAVSAPAHDVGECVGAAPSLVAGKEPYSRKVRLRQWRFSQCACKAK